MSKVPIFKPLKECLIDELKKIEYDSNLLDTIIRKIPDDSICNIFEYAGKYLGRILLKCTDETVKYIIDKQSDLEYVYDNGWRLIHYACRFSNLEIISYLVEKQVNLEAETTDFNYRPIHFVCKWQSCKTIKYMIDQDISLICTGITGWQGIHFLCAFSTDSPYSDLIKFETDESLQTLQGREKYFNNNPINKDIIKYIVDKGADIESVTGKGNRPIHFICRDDRNLSIDTLKFIVDIGMDINAKDEFGLTPLHTICASNCVTTELINFFADIGADFNVSDSDGNYPVHTICSNRCVTHEILQIFINVGPDLSVKNNYDVTPLHNICYNKCLAVDIVDMLVDHNYSNFSNMDRSNVQPIYALFVHSKADIIKHAITRGLHKLSDMKQITDCIYINFNLNNDERKDIMEMIQ